MTSSPPTHLRDMTELFPHSSSPPGQHAIAITSKKFLSESPLTYYVGARSNDMPAPQFSYAFGLQVLLTPPIDPIRSDLSGSDGY